MQHHEKMEYLTGQYLPSALHFLRAVECDDVNPFTPALSAWQGAPVESLETSSERQQFQGLHVAACSLLGVEPHAPDLRPLMRWHTAATPLRSKPMPPSANRAWRLNHDQT